MEICFALFCVASWIAVWVDRPQRERRSIAELAADFGRPRRRSGRAHPAGHVGACGANLAARSLAAVRLAPPRLRLDLARWARRPADRLGNASADEPIRRPHGHGPALLERRVRLRPRPDRVGHRRDHHPHADARSALADVVREDDPRQDRPAAGGHAPRCVQPAAHEAAARRSASSGRSSGRPQRSCWGGSSPARP